MDLIYTDSQKKDIGVLKDYTMDLAYGSDENNFELVVPLSKDNIIEYDSIVYMDGTEYGGFIDERVVSTTSSTITYKGRTPHGFLNSYVIYPNGPDGYRTVTGDALNILIDILDDFHLLDYFEFDTGAESIYIDSFKFRYEYIYDGIIKMLATVNAKLILIWNNGKIRVTIKTISNYADEQELDSSQLLFTIGNKENCVNHLLCLSRGELNDRKVISLYTNENGFIQPYLVNDPPYEDSDYVLDNTYQLLSGKDEICQIYDYPNASPVEKYKELTDMPDNWFDTYEQYYKLENCSYTQNETVYEDYYQQLTSQPADWASNYSDYYTLKENSPGVWEYINISSDLIDQYSLLNTEPPNWATTYASYFELDGDNYIPAVGVTTSNNPEKVIDRPNDWKDNYSSYYYQFNDGTQILYKPAEGVSKDRYEWQTHKPSDWNTNWDSYYAITMLGQYKQLGKFEYYTRKYNKKKGQHPKWIKNQFFTKFTDTFAPDFYKKTYYKMVDKTVAPKFEQNKYYYETKANYPDFTTIHDDKGVYKLEKRRSFPQYEQGQYFRKTIDNFETLVHSGIEHLTELNKSFTIELKTNATISYDIGDIIGARENITGIQSWQPVKKKIVTIENENDIKVEYEV